MVVEDHAVAMTLIEATLNYGNTGMGMVFTGWLRPRWTRQSPMPSSA